MMLAVNASLTTYREKKHERNAAPNLAESVHEPEISQLKPSIEPDHRFEVTLDSDSFTEEKFKLFENYQRNVHHEKPGEISKGGFKRFLCNSPIPKHTSSDGREIGSYHQCYRLNGRLIAMGVLDLLDHAVSAVYFIYHNDFERWSFGKLSAMREAALALEGGYKYYYMGFYIHSCAKMKYKGDYKPQYVLDVDSRDWDPLDDELKRAMESTTYAERVSRRKRLTSRKSSFVAGAEPAEEVAGVTADESEDETGIRYPKPFDAMMSNESLFGIGMPGVISLDRVDDEVDVGAIRLTPGGGKVFEAQASINDAINPVRASADILKGLGCVGREFSYGARQPQREILRTRCLRWTCCG